MSLRKQWGNLPFAQGGLNGFLQIPHEVSDSFLFFFSFFFLSIKIALQCVKGNPQGKAASHKIDIRIIEERQQSRQEEQEVIVVKNQNNLYLGKTGLQVYVKNKNSNISQPKTKDKRWHSWVFFLFICAKMLFHSF